MTAERCLVVAGLREPAAGVTDPGYRSGRRVIAVIAAHFLAATIILAGEAVTLRAGVSRADITPPVTMLNWTRTPPQPYGEVHDPLFARALVISDGETRLAVIQWDLLDAREFAVKRVRAAIQEATGIPPEHVIISASHDHSAPKSEMAVDPILRHEERTSRPVQNGPAYREWADKLVHTVVELVRQADASAEPVTLAIGRAYVGEWLFNRRPIRPDQNVTSMLLPKNPYVLGNGLRFGTLDPTLTVLGLRGAGDRNVCMLFHVPMHAVAIYGAYPGVSADWPGRVVDLLREQTGGEPIFLQGCAGDVVPARRGFEAVEAMAKLIAERAAAADKVALKLPSVRLRIARATIGLPATPMAAEDMQRPTIDAEITVVSLGTLALVALPGEPMQDISEAIVQRSPFPHTLVLGYANGRGVGYVGMPGGKAKGGYEMTAVGAGSDEAGGFLADTAVRLLREVAAPTASK